MSTEVESKKQTVVGSLALFRIPQDKSYNLATWYRVLGQTKKIIKMQRIKQNKNLTYRCQVFDLGASLQLRLEGNNQQEVKIFGPVKFDTHISKQLEGGLLNNHWFPIYIHQRANLTQPSRIRINSVDNGHIQFQIQVKKQQYIYFKVPLQKDWRDYQTIIIMENMKLNQIRFKDPEKIHFTTGQLKNKYSYLINKNYVLMSFSNIIQKNIFIAQIVLKANGKSFSGRNSQTKQVLNMDQKNSLDSQVDDLFRSNISNSGSKSIVSQNVINELKDVVFTPQLSTQNEEPKQKDFSVNSFHDFLNPQKENTKLKLPDIVEQQIDLIQRSTTLNLETTRNLNNSKKQTCSKRQKSKLCQCLCKQNKQYSNIFTSSIQQQNKLLIMQNAKLKRQNQILRFKMKKYSQKNGQIKYNIPQFLRYSGKSQKIYSQKLSNRDHKFDYKVSKKSRNVSVNSKYITLCNSGNNLHVIRSESYKNLPRYMKSQTQNLEYAVKSTKRKRSVKDQRSTLK